jgi:hypothetical protein
MSVGIDRDVASGACEAQGCGALPRLDGGMVWAMTDFVERVRTAPRAIQTDGTIKPLAYTPLQDKEASVLAHRPMVGRVVLMPRTLCAASF